VLPEKFSRHLSKPPLSRVNRLLAPRFVAFAGREEEQERCNTCC
jgi:hypothetical protein